jgi:hypothetical protein
VQDKRKDKDDRIEWDTVRLQACEMMENEHWPQWVKTQFGPKPPPSGATVALDPLPTLKSSTLQRQVQSIEEQMELGPD